MRIDAGKKFGWLVLVVALGGAATGCTLDGESDEDEAGLEEEGPDEPELETIEARAYHRGWHRVCANSLTFYVKSPGIYTSWLHWGDQFYIDHFGAHGDHAWGWAYSSDGWDYLGWGWVNNNWFC